MTRARRGMSVIYLMSGLTLFGALVSLAVELGRVQLVKTELQAAADAAARAAASGLPHPATVEQLAVQYASSNKADGKPVTLQVNQDVEMGTWDRGKQTFTVLHGNSRMMANAVRVSARRTQARDNAVELLFLPLLGTKSCNVQASAIASFAPPKPGIVGLEYVDISEKRVDKYNSNAGPYDPARGMAGAIFSNGNITLRQGAYLQGDAYPGIGKMVILQGGAAVTGSTTPLSVVLKYDMPMAGLVATQNDNVKLRNNIDRKGDFSVGGKKSLTISGGTYYVRNFSIGAGGTLTINGPCTFYVTGSISCNGSIKTYGDEPKYMKIFMCTSGTSCKITGSSRLFADFYGPGSSFEIAGGGEFFGGIIARYITCSGNGGLHFDEALDPGSGAITLVR